MAQPRQGRSRQGVEGFPATLATVALQAAGEAVPRQQDTRAMRTSRFQLKAGFNHFYDFGQVGLTVKCGLGHVSLMVVKPAQA